MRKAKKEVVEQQQKPEKLYAAVDPGTTGCLCIKLGEKIHIFDTPTYAIKIKRKDKATGKMKDGNKNLLDLKAVQEILNGFKDIDLPREALIEEQAPRARDGKAQVASIMRNFGSWIGILVANGFEVKFIKPGSWKSKLKIKAGSDKEVSRLLAIELFPDLKDELKLKTKHGRSDSLLLLKVLTDLL